MKAKNAVVGAKVMIKKSSRWYMGTSNNPKDTVGEILTVGDGTGLIIRVRWVGGYTNAYRYEDLKLVKE